MFKPSDCLWASVRAETTARASHSALRVSVHCAGTRLRRAASTRVDTTLNARLCLAQQTQPARNRFRRMRPRQLWQDSTVRKRGARASLIQTRNLKLLHAVLAKGSPASTTLPQRWTPQS